MATTTTHVASWGVFDAHTGLTILDASSSNSVVLAFDPTVEPVMAPETNEVGGTIGQALYDIHSTVRCTMNVKAVIASKIKDYVDAPSKFTVQVTIDSVKYYVLSLNCPESNTDYMKFNVVLEKFKADITPWDATEAQTAS